MLSPLGNNNYYLDLAFFHLRDFAADATCLFCTIHFPLCAAMLKYISLNVGNTFGLMILKSHRHQHHSV